MDYAHLCQDGTIYKWSPTTKHPKSCPRCKGRIDAPNVQKETVGQIPLYYSKRNYEKHKDTKEFKQQLKALET